MSALQVMRQRAAVSERNVVIFSVPAGMKNPTRPITVRFSKIDVMNQRIDSAVHDVGIGQKIPSRCEEPVWIAALAPADLQIMVERMDPVRHKVGVAPK